MIFVVGSITIFANMGGGSQEGRQSVVQMQATLPLFLLQPSHHFPNFRFYVSNFKFEISDLKFQILCFKFKIQNFRLQIQYSKFQMT